MARFRKIGYATAPAPPARHGAQIRGGHGEARSFRYDEANEPTPINQDEYDVLTDLAAHPRLVNAAPTSLDPNFHFVLSGECFLVKREAGADHWLPPIPSSMTVLLKKT